MNQLVAIVLACSGFWTVINSVVVYLISKKQRQDEEKSITKQEFDAVVRGVRGLLYAQLEKMCTEYITEGHITASDLNDLRRYFYEPYAEMHGDGTIKSLMERVENLPLKE